MNNMTKNFTDTMAQLTAVAQAVPGYIRERFRELDEAAAEIERETAAAKALGMSLLEYRIRKEYPDLLDADEDCPG